MIIACAIIICVILIVYFYTRSERFIASQHNTFKASSNIYLHNLHKSDLEKSKQLVIKIKENIGILMEHLGNKYAINKFNGFDKNHKNKIDQIKGTEMYSDNDIAAVYLEKKGIDREELLERLQQLFRNYDGNIYEISPTNTENLTSFTENKMRLVLCLREKTPDENGIYRLHDINTMMFVVLHELTHVLNDEYDHGDKFWALFEFILHNAIEVDIYKPEDYSKKNINYCGLMLTSNPIFF